MAFDPKSSRLAVMIAATIVTVFTVIAAFIWDKLDAGVPITLAGGWITLLGSYIIGKSYQNVKMNGNGNGHTDHVPGEG